MTLFLGNWAACAVFTKQHRSCISLEEADSLGSPMDVWFVTARCHTVTHRPVRAMLQVLLLIPDATVLTQAPETMYYDTTYAAWFS